MCIKLIDHHYFEKIMTLVTIMSSIQLAIDNPLNDPESTLFKVIEIVDYLITSIFGFEIILNIIANGFIFCGSRSFMKNVTNILDLFIVLMSVIFFPIYIFILDFLLFFQK